MTLITTLWSHCGIAFALTVDRDVELLMRCSRAAKTKLRLDWRQSGPPQLVFFENETISPSIGMLSQSNAFMVEKRGTSVTLTRPWALQIRRITYSWARQV